MYTNIIAEYLAEERRERRLQVAANIALVDAATRYRAAQVAPTLRERVRAAYRGFQTGAASLR